MAVRLEVMGGPGAEHARADHDNMMLHGALVGSRGRGRNGSAARPDKERAARQLEAWISRVHPARPAAAAAAAEVAAVPDMPRRLRLPSRPNRSGLLAAAAAEARPAVAEATAPIRSSDAPSGRSSAAVRHC